MYNDTKYFLFGENSWKNVTLFTMENQNLQNHSINELLQIHLHVETFLKIYSIENVNVSGNVSRFCDEC